MRGLSARYGVMAVLTAGLFAAPAASVNPTGPATAAGPLAGPALRQEALEFAEKLRHLFELIEQKYVRPVARADLADAVVTGLYDLVREPMPGGLRHEIRRAGDDELLLLLARVREALGPNDALRGDRALVAALRALPRALDPYCGLTTPLDRLLEYEGVVAGTGLEFPVAPAPPVIRMGPPGQQLEDHSAAAGRTPPAGPVRVSAVLPGSPAQRSGLRPDDLIVKINGQPPERPEFHVLFEQLRPLPTGAAFDRNARALRLTVLRGAAGPLEFSVAPALFQPESVFGVVRKPDGTWDFLLDPVDRLAYVRVGAIGSRTHAEFQAALQSLQSSSARGLVIDLRWCPGGLLRQAATIAHMLLPPDSPIATKRERGRVDPVEFFPMEVSFTEVPVVVLVNGETSGGGELIAAALQDHGRAGVAGQRTVGKASVQNALDDSRYSIPFKLTVGTYGRPSGRNLQRFPDSKPADDWGIRPDPGRELAVTPELSRRLKELHVLQTLRPPGDRTALPLDDPENDPQRQAAVQMLREIVGKK
jgi:carboxyl-terminal processing protease